jgi:hypothetical protein
VTSNERLLEEAHSSQGWFARNRYRMVSIAEAIYFVGLLMRSRGEIFFGASLKTNPYTLKSHLAPDVIPSRRRLLEWAYELQNDDPLESLFAHPREALAQSLLDRVSDLLNGRDNISLESARRQDNATLDGILYHLRGVVGSAAALFDSIAVIAHLAFDLELPEAAGDAAISLRRQQFRSRLRRSGATSLADAAAAVAPLTTFVWALRNPVLHREGISGYTYSDHPVPGRNDASRLALTDEQAKALESLCSQRRTEPGRWGLDGRPGLGPSVDPDAFGNRLVLETIAAVDELLAATADDLGLPEAADGGGDVQEPLPEISMNEMVRRFRWLSGLPTHGLFV